MVVTGGYGFVGSHLVEHLVNQGDQVTVLDNDAPPPDQDLRGVRCVDGDIRSPADVAKAITADVEIVYHLAAVVGVDRYLRRPLDVVDTNLIGTRNVLEAADGAGVKVVFASTSEIFGRNPAVPWAEDADRVLGSTATDRWSYSSSKALAEHLIYAFIRQRGLRATIVRYFNLYGPRQRPAFLISRSLHRVLRGLPPVVYDDGEQTRSFTFVDDAVEATLDIARSPKSDGECFNVGSSDEVSIRGAVELLVELTGADVEIAPLDTRRLYGETYQDLSRRIPDTTKIGTLVGWENRTALRDGLLRTIEWARANPVWLEQDESAPEPDGSGR
ncbi:NAD-dependent epimerase/dehydratase family protein [Nonomuraea sp. SYSU D8015]|uniref:NAD-dependent epimerase/dehydratase family protein n=1 Tax=Nonomuraea sp. SYSU D8015 TaxID=2593644 RepID=UPI00300C47C1